MSLAFTLTTLAATLVAQQPPKMETFTLRSGHTLRGEVLREKGDVLVIDIGVDIVKIPVAQVRDRRAADAKGGPGAAAAGPAYGESGELYATADLPEKEIKDLAVEFGEAVVLVKTPGGLGSGFVIDEQGHCITNCHVVEGETKITVDLFLRRNGTIVERPVTDVEIVALSPFFDLALLKIPVQKDFKFSRVYLASEADPVKQGDRSFAIGNPLGLSRTVSNGIISNRNRNMRGLVFLQTTAQINPGNSGGPLFNGRGQVIGVNSLKITSGEGMGFAIPVSYVKDFLKNREAFAYNKDNPNTGYHYLEPPRRRDPSKPATR